VIVLDASAAVDLVLGQAAAKRLGSVVSQHSEVHVPEHFHVEAISALRRLRLHGGLAEHAAQRALSALARLRAIRYPVLPLTDPIWSLRDQITAYDAAYLTLAARLDAGLLTTDSALASAARRHGLLA